MLVAESYFVVNDDVMTRLEDVPGDRLLIEPMSNTRERLAPEIRSGRAATIGGDPNCDLREATKAGEVQLGVSDTYEAAGDEPVTSCYDGALVRYRDGDRTVTVVGSADFMTNSGLLNEGNAALAMNLAGARPRLVWYAPQRVEGERTGGADIFDLIPDTSAGSSGNCGSWWCWSRCGRPPDGPAGRRAAAGGGTRVGDRRGTRPAVPVAPSRDRAAEALRTAALQRMLPRLGLAVNAPAPTVVAAWPSVAADGQNSCSTHCSDRRRRPTPTW